jgi:hypothetical protein
LEPLVGVLLFEGGDCLVLSEVSASLDPDGYCLLPRSDILTIDRDFDDLAFYRAALEAWEPVSLKGSELEMSDGLAHVLRSLGERSTLCAIHLEIDDPDVAYIGSVVRVIEDRLSFRNLSTRAQWVPELQTVRFGQISKIEVGTRYLTSLATAVAQNGSDHGLAMAGPEGSWRPITRLELETLVEDELTRCSPGQSQFFARYRVPFFEAPIHRSGEAEKVFVVAQLPAGVIYYEDVEDGFEFSSLARDGSIEATGSNQFELRHVLSQLGA